MSSFESNVLSKKVPEFSMAVVEAIEKLENILKWARKKNLEMKRTWWNLNGIGIPFICKMHKKNQETRTKNENGSCSLLFVNKGFKNVNGGVIKLGFGFGVLRKL